MNRAKAMRQRGMTLVELLVALAIFGLLALLLSGGLQFGARTWETTSAVIEEGARVRNVQALLRTILAQSHPVRQDASRSDPRRSAYIAFSGDKERVDFAAKLPSHLSNGGLSAVTIKKVVGNGKDTLVMEWRPFDTGFVDPVSNDQVIRATLVDDVTLVSFSYLIDEATTDSEGQSGEAVQPRWVDQVAEVVQLPLLVRLNVKKNSARTGAWPELTVELPSRRSTNSR